MTRRKNLLAVGFEGNPEGSFGDGAEAPFDDDTIPRNIRYYYPRSAHDSSLSRVADTWVLARADRPISLRVSSRSR